MVKRDVVYFPPYTLLRHALHGMEAFVEAMHTLLTAMGGYNVGPLSGMAGSWMAPTAFPKEKSSFGVGYWPTPGKIYTRFWPTQPASRNQRAGFAQLASELVPGEGPLPEGVKPQFLYRFPGLTSLARDYERRCFAEMDIEFAMRNPGNGNFYNSLWTSWDYGLRATPRWHYTHPNGTAFATYPGPRRGQNQYHFCDYALSATVGWCATFGTPLEGWWDWLMAVPEARASRLRLLLDEVFTPTIRAARAAGPVPADTIIRAHFPASSGPVPGAFDPMTHVRRYEDELKNVAHEEEQQRYAITVAEQSIERIKRQAEFIQGYKVDTEANYITLLDEAVQNGVITSKSHVGNGQLRLHFPPFRAYLPEVASYKAGVYEFPAGYVALPWPMDPRHGVILILDNSGLKGYPHPQLTPLGAFCYGHGEDAEINHGAFRLSQLRGPEHVVRTTQAFLVQWTGGVPPFHRSGKYIAATVEEAEKIEFAPVAIAPPSFKKTRTTANRSARRRQVSRVNA